MRKRLGPGRIITASMHRSAERAIERLQRVQARVAFGASCGARHDPRRHCEVPMEVEQARLLTLKAAYMIGTSETRQLAAKLP